MSDVWYRRGVATLTLALVSVLTLWALLAPGFRGPDEPHHLNSVMRLASGGGWPEPGAALISQGTLDATREAGFSRPDQNVGIFTASVLPRGTLRGFGLDFAGIVPGDPAERSVVDYTQPTSADVQPSIDQMTQHPPLYYGLAAAVVKAFGALEWRWDNQLLLLRLLNVVLIAPVLPLVAGTTRLLTSSRTTALVAAGALVGIGQFAHINSTVTNDALTTLLAVVITYLCARALTVPHAGLLPAVTGLVLGVGLLTKGFLLAAIPLVALALVASPLHSRVLRLRLLDAAVAMVIAFVVGGWWWLRNLLVHGALQPSGLPPLLVDWGDQTPTVPEYVREAVDRLNTSFWGNFGWLELPLPTLANIVLGSLLVLGVLAAFAAPRARRSHLAVLLVLPIGTLAIVFYGGITSYYETGLFGGHQGRYLYTGIAVLLAAAATGAVGVARRLAPRAVPYLPAWSVGLALASAGYALLRAFQGFYQPFDQTPIDALVRWDAWSLLERAPLAVLTLLPVGLGGLALVTAYRAGVRGGTATPDADVDLEPTVTES